MKKNIRSQFGLARRHYLQVALFGGGALALRSLVTGLPRGFLQTGSTAHAAEPGEQDFLIISHSNMGDPLNVHCPGSFVDGVQHNPAAALAPTDFSLGESPVTAAQPWADLSEDLRARMAFVHHRTYTNAHPEMPLVLSGHGSVTATDSNIGEMFPSALARYIGQTRETIQPEPVAVGTTRLTYEGRPLDLVRPTELKGLFDAPEDVEGALRTLRDAELDRVYSEIRTSGSPAQRSFLDRYATGREQARQIGADLATLLTRVPLDDENQNSERDQIIAAVGLLTLNVAPVLSIHLSFGGDNHADRGLVLEAGQTVSGVASIQFLWDELNAAGLADRTTFATMNVFGRTLLLNGGGGRNHNGDHHVMCMFGPRVRGGVYGGLERGRGDFQATGIDSATGASTPDGDIAPEVSLESSMRTLGAAAGVDEEILDTVVSGGKTITAALA